MPFFVGIPLSAADFYDKGVEPLLDYLKNTVKVNALIVQGRTFHGENGYETRGEYYAFTRLRGRPSELKKKGFDVFEEITDKAHERGIRVYSHFLSYDFITLPGSGGGRGDTSGANPNPNAKLGGLSHVLEIDMFGRKHNRPCLNHPDYRAYHYAVAEDQLRGYPLDGINFNIERYGPLATVMIGTGTSGDGRKPIAATCFCPYCLEEARRRGIDAGRAKEGFLKLLELSERSWRAALKNQDPFAVPGRPLTGARDTSPPPDGYFIEFIRLISRYPEALAWNQMWHDNMLGLLAGVYGTAKAVSPDREVGYHVWHQRAYSPFERAFYNPGELRRFCDWIKPKMDHTCGGYRFYRNILRIHQAYFYDRDVKQAAAAMNAIFNWDYDPGFFDKLPEQGLGLDYLEKDTKAYIAGVHHEVPVYPGIGIDMPAGTPERIYRECEPEYVYRGLLTVAKAGAKGTVLSRGYGEMREKNLEAAGKAIDEINRLYKFD
jgi:hypothetical protein